MKRKLLFAMLCIVGALTTVVNAQQVPVSGRAYYLYNVETGKFLTRGDNWGTRAVANDFGSPWKVTINNGRYQLQMYDLVEYGNTNGLDAYSFTDSQSPLGFTLTGDASSYKLKNGSYYLTAVAGGTDHLVNVDGNSVTGNTTWQFLNPTEYKAVLAAKAAAQEEFTASIAGLTISGSLSDELSTHTAIDKTSSISSVTSSTGWTFTGVPNRGGDYGFGSYGTELAEGGGTYKQIVSGLAPGIYKVGVKAMFRSTSNEVCSTIGNAGYVNSSAFLKANGCTAQIKDWYSGRASATNPNTTGQFTTRTNAGNYYTEVFCCVGTDGNLEISATSESFWWSSWFIVGGFTLTYYEDTFVDDPTSIVYKPVYLRNVGTGKFWGAGNAWGTQPTLVNEQCYVKLAKLSDGTYSMETLVSNGGSSYYFDGTWMDSGTIKHLSIQQLDNGYWTIGDNEDLYGYDGLNSLITNSLSDASNANYQWEILTQSDLDNYNASLFASASEFYPIDASFLIKDNGFGRNRRDAVAAWNPEGNIALGGLNNDGQLSSDISNYCAESYHSTFAITQTITNAPKGVYRLQAQGFYRQDGSDNNHLPVFFINNSTQTFPIISGSENSMSDAGESFMNGEYQMVPLFVELTSPGTLTVGARLSGNSNLWCIWDNFTLLYYGEDANLTTVQENDSKRQLIVTLLEYVSKCQSLAANSELPTSAKNNLLSVADQYANADYTNMSASALQTGIEELNAAYTQCSSLVSPYQYYLSVLSCAESVKASNIYTDVDGARQALETAIDNARQSANQVTSLSTLTSITNTLSNAIKSFVGKVNIKRGTCFDLTGLIQNSGMDGLEGWMGDEPTYIWYGVPFSNAEFFNIDFDIYQTLNNMPKGNYSLKVQAFQRPGSNDVAYENYQNGIDNINSYIYINDGETKIKNVMSEYSPSCLLPESTAGGNNWPDYRWPNGQGYTPNGMEGARLYFDAGYYDNEVVTDIEAGNLRFGFRCTNHADAAWTLFDNFRLYYYGSAIDMNLDEQTDFRILNDIENANVTMNLNIAANTWYPLVFPFNLSLSQLQDASNGTIEICSFDGQFEDVLIFAPSTQISANIPFLLRTQTAQDIWLFDGCKIIKNDDPKQTGSLYNLIGNYTYGTIVPQGNYLLSSNGLTVVSTTTPLNSFHAYIEPKMGTQDPLPALVTDGLDPKRVDSSEWDILMRFHSNMNGTNWTTPWQTNSTPTSTRDLPGVTATDGHVLSIELPGNSIQGSYLGVLLTLPYLERIDLSKNSISGNVNSYTPSSSIQELNISNNKLSGNIGLLASKCPSLTLLNASGNRFTEVSPVISNIVSTLDLSNQTLGTTIELDLGNCEEETMLAALPTILSYQAATRTYSPNMDYVCSSGSLSGFNINTTKDFALDVSYRDGGLTINKVSSDNVYRGLNSDLLNAKNTLGHTFKIHLSYPTGDSNFNGNFDAADLITSINYIFDDYNTQPFNYVAANLYSDEIINVQDIVLTVDGLLAQNNASGGIKARRVKAENKTAEASLFWRGQDLVLLTTKPIAVLDMTIEAPFGISWNFNSAGLQWKSVETDGCQHVVAYSLSGNVLPVGETVIATSTMRGEIINLCACDNSASYVHVQLPDDSATVIEHIDSNDQSTSVYDLSGRRVDITSLKSGVYIINGKKVIIKK